MNNEYSKFDCSKIKMVIWDLDDTLWKGTLSEESVIIDNDKIELIKFLNKKGIVNSICSKNDEIETVEYLRKNGIDELFVFASINWLPKGKRIYDIINNAHLRPANVLFIDDNISNLKEVCFYCKDIMTLYIEDYMKFYNEISTMELKDNSERINQYKLLEKKKNAREKTTDNISFLRSCDIHVDIKHDCINESDRILELINRTNQLNFTKKRIKLEELLELLNDRSVNSGYVVVSDAFGEYGIAGFYAIRNGILIHFLFSCRTMGMGIEQWVYNYLGKPQLKIVGEVSSDLEQYDVIDWIHNSARNNILNDIEKKGRRFLFKGPCDISQAAAYINSTSITEEYTYISQRNGASVFCYNHTEFIRQLEQLPQDTIDEMIQDIPFLDEYSFKTTLFSEDYDVIVLSLMVDYSLGLYKRKDNSYVLPLFQYTLPITDDKCEQGYREGKYYFQNLEFDEAFYDWFKANFEYIGVITKERLLDNILYIRKKIHPNTKLILLNGSEIPHKNPDAWMEGREKLHKEYNMFLREKLKNIEGIEILEVSKFIHGSEDYYDAISHFKKKVYYDIAQEIISLCDCCEYMSSKSVLFREYDQIRTVMEHFLIKIKKKLGIK